MGEKRDRERGKDPIHSFARMVLRSYVKVPEEFLFAKMERTIGTISKPKLKTKEKKILQDKKKHCFCWHRCGMIRGECEC